MDKTLFDLVPVRHLDGGYRLPGNEPAPPAAECTSCDARISIAGGWNFCPWCGKQLAYGNRPDRVCRIFIEVGEELNGSATATIALLRERVPEVKFLSRHDILRDAVKATPKKH